SANSLASYRQDLEKLAGSLAKPEREASAEDLTGHVQGLFSSGLAPRSIARHVATIRNFYKFLTREGEIPRDPAEFLVPPRTWSTIPKYLNREEIENLLAAPPESKATGLRDRAMLELLYATGLRVSELCLLDVAGVQRSLGLLRV